MRREDIIVTTPEKSVIYAIGTLPEKSSKVWEEDMRSRNRHYTPGYVLEIKDGGFATILVATHHPDHTYGAAKEQASVLDALSYTLADHEARVAVNRKYSHWPLTPEQREAHEAELAPLKKVPNGWRVGTERTSNVRLLWGEYASRLSALNAQRKIDSDARDAKDRADKDKQTKVLQRLAKLKIGFKNTEDQFRRARRYGGSEVFIDVKVIDELVRLAKVGREVETADKGKKESE